MAKNRTGAQAGQGEQQAPATKKQIIYVARTARTVVVQKSQSGFISQPDGSITPQMKAGPVRVQFLGGWFKLTDESAKAHGLTFDQLKGLIEAHSQFKTGEIRVGTDEDVERLMEAGMSNKTQVGRGPRAA